MFYIRNASYAIAIYVPHVIIINIRPSVKIIIEHIKKRVRDESEDVKEDREMTRVCS